MSSTTPNLGLTKTTAAETIGQNWAASNDSGGNFDIIDTKMGAVGSQSVQTQLDALSSQTSNMFKSKMVNYAPSTGVTAGTSVDITSAVDLPSGASVKGIAVQCIYGGSAIDYNAVVVYNPTNNHFVLMPTITQTPIRANFVVFYS